MMPADLRLEGTHNFRSLHGIPTQNGRMIGHHVVLRSDRLNSLTQRDWETLRDIGLKTICDLRGLEERIHAPTPLWQGFIPHVMNFDVRNDVRSDPELAKLLLDNTSVEGSYQLMHEIYRRFPAVFAERLRVWFRLFEAGTPMIVHCTAGKDRTGFLVALLLHALGVSREEIDKDYLLSGSGLGLQDPRIPGLQALYRNLSNIEITPQAIVPILDVQCSYLDAAFDSIVQQYGSVECYLERHAGLNAAGLSRLQTLCLE